MKAKQNKKVLLIITGSIAAYKAMDLVRLLKKQSFEVTCVLTKAACEFITPLLAASLSGNKTYNELFSIDDEIEMGHINLSRQHDLIIVAPATADFIAKIANGFADDLASNVVLAANKKIIIAPAMNEKMWQKKSTQENLQKLIQSQVVIVEPQKDVLACGEFGIGKMAEVEEITKKVNEFFVNQNRLTGKKILITGGATYEPIDPVRFIGNYSSGKQAIAIAEILNEMNADVTLVAANIYESITLSNNKIIRVKTAQEMMEVVAKNISKIDVFIGCAAVSDFRVKNFSAQKIKKNSLKNPILELEKNPDILEFVGNNKKRPQLVIGFAAEDKNLQKYAQEKLYKKNCDLIVANDIKKGKIFGSNQTDAIFVQRNKSQKITLSSKSQVAELLAQYIVSFFK